MDFPCADSEAEGHWLESSSARHLRYAVKVRTPTCAQCVYGTQNVTSFVWRQTPKHLDHVVRPGLWLLEIEPLGQAHGVI